MNHQQEVERKRLGGTHSSRDNSVQYCLETTPDALKEISLGRHKPRPVSRNTQRLHRLR